MQGVSNRHIDLNKEQFNLEKLIEFRHWMHQNAEVSLKEFNTIKRIKDTLLSFGIPEDWMTSKAGTGLIVDMKGTAEVKGEPFTVALRSDHDALPMKENNPHLEYESKTGAAHMCGHDGHTTCLLGGAWLIFQNLDRIPKNKTVRAVFQPAEEGWGGAQKMTVWREWMKFMGSITDQSLY